MAESKLDLHIKNDCQRFDKIEAILDKIQNNHLAHLQMDITATKVHLEWLKKAVFWLVGLIVSSGVINLVV